MNNGDMRLLLAKNCQGGRVYPEVFAEMNSEFLWSNTYERAHEQLRKMVGTFAVIVGEKVNRADACVDIADDLPILDLRKGVVTRALKKVDYHQIEHYTSGVRDTGYRFGAGSIMGRIYDKTYEAKHSHKEYFKDVWIPGGWDMKSNITRFEFQNRRPVLKEFGINSYDDLIKGLPDIWQYMTTIFLVLKQPNENDSNHRRWQTSALWNIVQGAGIRFGECKGFQRWKQKQAQIEPLMAQIVGLMASVIAIDSQIRGEYHATDRLRATLKQTLDSEQFRIKAYDRRGRYANLKP